jgi:hypothetical protein
MIGSSMSDSPRYRQLKAEERLAMHFSMVCNFVASIRRRVKISVNQPSTYSPIRFVTPAWGQSALLAAPVAIQRPMPR